MTINYELTKDHYTPTPIGTQENYVAAAKQLLAVNGIVFDDTVMNRTAMYRHAIHSLIAQKKPKVSMFIHNKDMSIEHLLFTDKQLNELKK